MVTTTLDSKYPLTPSELARTTAKPYRILLYRLLPILKTKEILEKIGNK